MQQCGISTIGAMAFQPVLKFNTTVSVLDLRLNPLIGKCNKAISSITVVINLNQDQLKVFTWPITFGEMNLICV